ncbi:MAG: hypothetical protein DI537_32895 [Stutzerimonas stutzeri]|nr:MAG: hypothetical protein DI537_32895 [Stutzerimonas stutzeri]
MGVAQVPPPPLGPAKDWPASRFLQIAGYVGVMILAMRTFPEPLNHWVPVILFGVTAATIMLINAMTSCSMTYLEPQCDLSYPKWTPTFVFPAPPDAEQPRRIFMVPYPFDPVGVIS